MWSTLECNGVHWSALECTCNGVFEFLPHANISNRARCPVAERPRPAMVEINLTWQAASFFCASLLLSAVCIGGTIHPFVQTREGCPLCLICPQKGDMLFQNGAAFVYHIVCFLHYGGMASGSVGLVLSLIGMAWANPGDYLKVVFATVLPVVWVAAWGVQLYVLTVGDDGWRAYDATAKDENGKPLVPSTIGLWWTIFAFLLAAVTTLIITSASGIMADTYVKLDTCE